MFRTLAHLANTRPWRVLIVAVAGFALVGIWGAPVPNLLSNGNDSFVDPGSASIRATQTIERATGQCAQPSIVAVMEADNSRVV